jgi:asparagine synthase (glutamine-hydrolysing)
MCGIAGIWTNKLNTGALHTNLLEAIARLRHRGPDDRGTWVNEVGVGLGQSRLSILDLSDSAHQPMISDDGRYVLVFNGEIYNFKEVRNKLRAAGHTFRGSGDTEVVLHAYQQWGSDAVHEFIGMFAIALWDEHTRTLELVRDRIGVKPLYFGWDGSSLCFASELKALRAFPHWKPVIDPTSLGEYLQYGYISDDRTIYQSVHKLRPAHRLKLTQGKAPVVERYWSAVPDDMTNSSQLEDAEIEARLEELLIDAFRYRMVSDVPVGVFLSGGVDSSLLTAILAKHHDQPVHTFTIGFEESTHDESKWAKRVAAHCGTVHTEHILSAREAIDIARKWGDLFDEPFGDDSGIPTLLVSRLAAREVKVVLSADGGDEQFSGYHSYTGILDRYDELRRIPLSVRRFLARGATLVGSVDARRMPAAQRMTRKAARVGATLQRSTPGELMEFILSQWQPESIGRLLGSYRAPRETADAYPGTPADQLSLWDFHHYLPEDILTKVDRTTMAVSIEGREPLLDHRIAEFAFRLPLHLRRGSLGPKHILKRILYRYVPRELVDRPKQGFEIPLGQWLRNDLKDLARDYLSADRIRSAGIMDWKMIDDLMRDFFAGNDRLTSPVWFVLAFEMWRERWA